MEIKTFDDCRKKAKELEKLGSVAKKTKEAISGVLVGVLVVNTLIHGLKQGVLAAVITLGLFYLFNKIAPKSIHNMKKIWRC